MTRLRQRTNTTAKLPIYTVIALLTFSVFTYGQTLDEQYNFYLSAKCSNLNFERDATSTILPGQAGPNLFAFCNGPIPQDSPVPGVTITINAVGGAAGAGAGRDNNGEEAALRRRQQQLRDDKDDATRNTGTDFTLLAAGNFAAFLSVDFQRLRQKNTPFESGKAGDRTGAIVGADYRFGATGVFGVAATQYELDGDFSGGGGFAQKSKGLLLYGSWFPTDTMFVDASVGTESIDQRTRRLVGRRIVATSPTMTTITFDPPLASASGNTDSQARFTQLRGGYDFFRGAWTLGSRLGVSQRRTEVDGFLENGVTPMTLRFNRQLEKSLTTSLGMQASHAHAFSRGVMNFQFNIDWLHEHQNDQRTLTARFAEDLRPNATQLRFLNQAPDRNWYEFSVSTTAVFSEGLSAFLSVDTLVAHAYQRRVSVSLGLRYEF